MDRGPQPGSPALRGNLTPGLHSKAGSRMERPLLELSDFDGLKRLESLGQQL